MTPIASGPSAGGSDAATAVRVPVPPSRLNLREIDATNSAKADAMTRTMCQKRLANPVTEDFEIASVKT